MKKLLWAQLLGIFLFFQSANASVVVPSALTEIPAAVVANSVKEWNQLSKKEKKARYAAVKKEVKNFRKKGDTDERTILLVILAILLPPLAVYLHQNEINTKFWISLILTLLFWIPGVIYSLLVVLGIV